MLVYLASLFIQAVAADSAPIRPIAQMVHSRWTAKEGAPPEIRALAQSKEGYLWLGTSRGLVRFDGARFVPVPAPDSTLKAIRRLITSRDGTLWIVWARGPVSRMRGGQWTSWSETDGLPAVGDLTVSSTGIVVAATLKGLWRLDGESWTDATLEWKYPGTQSRAVWFDRDDGLWSETESRIVHMPSGSDRFAEFSLPLANQASAAGFAQEANGTIWMNELSRNSVHTLIRPGDRIPETEVLISGWTLLIDRRGSLWIGSLTDGLRRVADPARVRAKVIARFGAEAESFTLRDGLLANIVYAMLEARDGSIWVSSIRGLERFSEGAFTPIVTPGATRLRYVYSTADSAIWIRAFGQFGFVRIDPSTRKAEAVLKGFIPLSFFQDRSGAIWTTAGPNTFTYGAKQRDFVFNSIKPGDARALYDVVVDTAGIRWFIDQTQGLMRLAGDSLVRVVSLPPSTGPTANLLYDRRGRLWIQRIDQLFVYERGALKLFNASRGEAPARLTGVMQDHAGDIWVMGPAGLSRFEGNRFHTLTERQGVPERMVTAAAQDAAGAWWLATNTGVLRLPPGEVERALADSSYTLKYRRFGELDGVPGNVASVTYAADGKIWIGTDSVAASIDPRQLPPSTIPSILVEGIRVDNREYPISSAVRISPNGRDFEIDYTSTSLAIADRIQFRYQLDGEDPEWRDVGTRRRAYYTRLDPGQYTFRVTARTDDGVWNDAPAVLHFRVLPAWYQTGVFKGSAVLLILGIGAAGAWTVQRGRQQQMTRVLTSQHQATLAERTRLAGEFHDTLLQAFTGVTLQLEGLRGRMLTKPEEAERDLGRMLKVADVALRDARSAVWDLRAPDLDGRDVATALEEVAREAIASHCAAGGASVNLEVTIAGDSRRLSPTVETCAHRVGREAVANALRHADAKCISLAIGFEPHHLCVDVRDDGVGFDAARVDPTKGRGHWGLVGMEERARNAHGTLDVTSAPGAGTTIRLRIPVESN